MLPGVDPRPHGGKLPPMFESNADLNSDGGEAEVCAHAYGCVCVSQTMQQMQGYHHLLCSFLAVKHSHVQHPAADGEESFLSHRKGGRERG